NFSVSLHRKLKIGLLPLDREHTEREKVLVGHNGLSGKFWKHAYFLDPHSSRPGKISAKN
ncbi:hypothetical protein GOODEAATRI_002756, partial [Goodea atripinnis]